MLHLSKKTKNRVLLPLVFLFFLLINLTANGGHTDISDGFRAFLITENLALNGKLGYSIDLPSANPDVWFLYRGQDLEFKLNAQADIAFIKNLSQLEQTQNQEAIQEFKNNRESWKDDYKENHKNEFFDQVPLALPVVAFPFYLLALTWELNPLYIVPFFVNSIVIATICLVIFTFGRELFKSNRIGFVLSIIFGLTSFFWPYISSMYSRPLASLFVILCIYLIFYQKKKTGFIYAILAGLSLGLSIITQPHMIMLSPILGIYGFYQFRKNKKQIVAFILILLIMISLIASINYYRDGSIEDFGFRNSNPIFKRLPISNPDVIENRIKNLDALYGILISPGKGLFVFFPLALLLPFSLFYLYKDNKSLALVFIFIIFLVYLFVGTSGLWDKNGSMWGPHRYILPILPLIALSLGSLISRFPHSVKMIVTVVVLGIAGFFVNLLGNLSNVMLGIFYAQRIEHAWQLSTPVVRSLMAWDPNNTYITQIFKVFLNNYGEKLTGCSYDLYLYCNFGLPVIILLGAIISVIGILIMYFLGFFQSKNSQKNNYHKRLNPSN